MRTKPIDVLLAEDNEGDVVLVKEALRNRFAEYTLKVVANGDEAGLLFEQIASNGKSHCPDIFLVDLNLPKASGFGLLQSFREHCGGAIPVVVLSSSQAPNDVTRSFALGANHFFRKPSDLDEFLALGALVEELLDGSPDTAR